MTKIRFIFIGVVIIAAGVMLLMRQHTVQLGLRADNFALQQEVDQLAPLAEEHLRLSNQIAQAQGLSQSSTNQLAELERLRTEVAAQKGELQKLQAELAAELAVPTFQSLPGSNRFLYLPKESWTLAGYSTPEAAFQSMLSATLQGDVNGIRASITPAEQERRMKREWKDKSDSEIANAGVQGLSKATGIQILNMQMMSQDEAHFTVYISGFDHPDQPLWMDVKRIGGEWKVDASEHHRDGP